MAHIDDLEVYLAKLQSLEVNFSKENSAVDKIVKTYAVKPEFYTSLTQIRNLRHELEAYLDEITPKVGNVGKLMSEKAMSNFLLKSERKDLTVKQLNAVETLNARQVERRILLYKSKVLKETNFLKAEIDEFFINASLSGRSRKVALTELIKAAADNTGLTTGFAKKLKRVTIDAARREAQQQATEEYRKFAKPNEKWQWISVSVKPCPDCQPRAGVVLPYQRWVQEGLPGSGRTICGASCKCQLVPISISDELFPDVKTFKWDKKNLVLTTAGEARTFKAKSNKPPQKE